MSSSLDRRAFLAAGLMVLGSASARADDGRARGQEILAQVDKVRNPGHAFRVKSTLVEYRQGRPQDQVVLDILAKPSAATHQLRNLARYLAPARDKNKLFLMDGGSMWFYDPASSASVRISPQQRLLGQASNGDVLATNLAQDYDATYVGEEAIKDADRNLTDTWRLQLNRKAPGATYNKIDCWIQKSTFFMIKGRFYADSGRELKSIYYRDFRSELGGMRPREALIVDQVDTALVTKMTFGDYQATDIPDLWLQRDYLPRLRLK